MQLVTLYTPRSQAEASAIEALMRAYDIHYVMQGSQFSTMYPGSVTDSLNAQKLMVRAEQEELARQLLAPFMDGDAHTPDEP